MKNKIAWVISMLTLTLASVLIVYFFYLQFYPFQVVSLHDNPIPVSKKIVKQGDEQCIEMNFTKHYDFNSEVQFYIENGQLFTLQSKGVTRSVGNYSKERCFTIPCTLHEGIYPIKISLTYRPTPFRQILYTWESEKFQVVKAGETL